MKLYLVIRLRGRMGIAPELLDTMNRLNLPRKHNAALITDTPSNIGMLNKAVDYITWGEITKGSLVDLLKKRGRLAGDERITKESLKKAGMGTFEALAGRIMEEGKVPAPIKRTFRLTPPSGGFKGHVMRHIGSGGELGYRGSAINDLIQRMI
ncbi:MAG: 50S ribosomal protein L30 [Candidatus Verstraetearchaeota archaeon]|nr:50S ribosomal protein L30 [Candidatus Verstraetearchaeota archaeon]